MKHCALGSRIGAGFLLNRIGAQGGIQMVLEAGVEPTCSVKSAGF